MTEDKRNDYVTELHCICEEMILLVSRSISLSDDEKDAFTAPIYHLQRVMDAMDAEDANGAVRGAEKG